MSVVMGLRRGSVEAGLVLGLDLPRQFPIGIADQASRPVNVGLRAEALGYTVAGQGNAIKWIDRPLAGKCGFNGLAECAFPGELEKIGVARGLQHHFGGTDMQGDIAGDMQADHALPVGAWRGQSDHGQGKAGNRGNQANLPVVVVRVHGNLGRRPEGEGKRLALLAESRVCGSAATVFPCACRLGPRVFWSSPGGASRAGNLWKSRFSCVFPGKFALAPGLGVRPVRWQFC